MLKDNTKEQVLNSAFHWRLLCVRMHSGHKATAVADKAVQHVFSSPAVLVSDRIGERKCIERLAAGDQMVNTSEEWTATRYSQQNIISISKSVALR